MKPAEERSTDAPLTSEEIAVVRWLARTPLDEQVCRVCACSTLHACPGQVPCRWVAPGLCSGCAVEALPEDSAVAPGEIPYGRRADDCYELTPEGAATLGAGRGAA